MTHDTVSLGNNRADQVAGQIALQQGPLPILFLKTSPTPNYSKAKMEAFLSQEGASKHPSGWITLHDKLVLPEKQAMSIITQIHDSLTTVACDGLRRGPLSPNPPICGKPGIFFLCNQTTLLQCFPPNWTQPCTPVFLMPYLTILTPQAMEDQIRPTHRRRRALAAAPLLLGGGLFTALGLGAGGLGSATHFCYKQSTDLNRDLDKVADSLMALQTQITSLAAVACQNRRALDLLRAEKGGPASS